MTSEQLLDRWRSLPARELAEALERDLAEAEARPSPTDHTEWLARAKKVKPSALGELSALLASMRSRKLAEIAERTRALVRLLPDPRIASALGAFVRAVSFTSNSSVGMWSTVLSTLEKSGDPRAIEWLAETRASLGVREGFRKLFEPMLVRTEAALKAAFPAGVPPLGEVDEATRIHLARELPPKPIEKNEPALFAAVYARPGEDGPRLVLADHLQEKGDPRGELIMLQCQGEERRRATAKREGALLGKHRKAWLGELAPFVAPDATFERGFVARASLETRNEMEAKRAAALPSWATVVRLDVSRAFPLLPNAAKSIRALAHASEEWLPVVAASSLRLEEISFGTVYHRDLWTRFQASDAARSLKRVHGIPVGWMPSEMLARLEETSAPDALDDSHLNAVLDHPDLQVTASGADCEARVEMGDGLLTVTFTVSIAERQESWSVEGRALPTAESWVRNRTTELIALLTPDAGQSSIQRVRVLRKTQNPELLMASVEAECLAAVRKALGAWSKTLDALIEIDTTAIGGKRVERAAKVSQPVRRAPKAPVLGFACRLAWRARGLYVLQNPCLLLDPHTGALLREVTTDGYSSEVLDRTGRYLAYASSSTRVIDLEAGDDSREITGVGGYVTSAALSDGGKRLLMLIGDVYMDRRCEVIQLDGPTKVTSLLSRRGNDNGTLSPDGRYAVLARGGSKLEVFDVDNPKAKGVLLASVDVDNYTHCAFSPSGDTLAVETQDHQLLVFDFPARKLRRTFQLHSRSQHVCDDRIVVVAGDEGLTLCDLGSGEMRSLTTAKAQTVAISPDGSEIAARIENALVVLDLEGRERLRLPCVD